MKNDTNILQLEIANVNTMLNEMNDYLIESREELNKLKNQTIIF